MLCFGAPNRVSGPYPDFSHAVGSNKWLMNTQFVEIRLLSYILAFLHVVNINDTTSTCLHCSLLHIGTQSPTQYFHIIGLPPMAYYWLLFCLVHWAPERTWIKRSGENSDILGPRNAFLGFLGPRTVFWCIPAYFHHWMWMHAYFLLLFLAALVVSLCLYTQCSLCLSRLYIIRLTFRHLGLVLCLLYFCLYLIIPCIFGHNFVFCEFC